VCFAWDEEKNMSDQLMPSFQLKLSRDEFDRLPRHPAYKYELINGVTHLSPWPRYGHAQLDLGRFRPEQGEIGKADLRLVRAEDKDPLVPIFLAAFGRTQPYGSLSEEDRRRAGEAALERTFSGGDGPLAAAASFVALQDEVFAGAILITLLPGGDPTDWDCYHWEGDAPRNLWQERKGQPHLTWIFVRRFAQGHGVGTQLLNESVRVLEEQGYPTLWTTFMIGNDSSMLWHWRNGFELFPHMMSKRRRLANI
jgi:GNAT superfamily N-acetyltransferase